MAITRHQLPSDLEPGLNAHFGRAYAEHPEEWSKFLDKESSSKAWEEDVLQTGFGAAPRKPEGAAVAFDEISEGWTQRYVHETYALAFSITQEAIEDNLYERQAPKNAQALARAMRHTKEINAADVLNNGFSGSFLGGDGKSLFATDHPTLSAGDQSNKLAVAADLSEASLEDIGIQIMQAKDDRGIQINLNMKKLIVSPSDVYQAQRILGSVNRVGTADNDINALKSLGHLGIEDIVKVTRLTDTDAWFVKTDCPEGMKMVERTAMQRGMDQDFATGNYSYKCRERYSVGWTDWRSCYGSEGAA